MGDEPTTLNLTVTPPPGEGVRRPTPDEELSAALTPSRAEVEARLIAQGRAEEARQAALRAAGDRENERFLPGTVRTDGPISGMGQTPLWGRNYDLTPPDRSIIESARASVGVFPVTDPGNPLVTEGQFPSQGGLAADSMAVGGTVRVRF